MSLMKRIVRSIANHAGLDITRTHAAFRAQSQLLGKPPAPIIFDVGANEGQTTRLYRKFFPGGTVHAFEPFVETYNKLVASVGSDPMVRTHSLALTQVTGQRP